MGKIKTYPSYSNSGNSWLLEIPEHWLLFRLKYVFRITKRIVGELGHDVLSITQRGIKLKDTESGAGQLSMDYSKYQQVDKGDFAMNHMDLLTGYVDISQHNGVVSPDYRVFKLIHKESDSQYLLYIQQLCYTQKIFFRHGKGVSMLGRWRLPAENFKNFIIPIPPKEEQIKIAVFLNYKLAKINRFIRKKKQLIKLLNEQKKAIINKAVTKGINPNVKMKPSSIEWLGDIPDHWEVKRLKYLLKAGQDGIKIGPFGSAIKSEIIRGKNGFSENESFYKVYGQEHPIASNFSIGNKYIGQEDFDRLNNYEIISGDIVISMMGTIGRSKVVPNNIEKGIMDSHLIRIGVNSEIYSDYISMLINDSSSIMTNMLYESKGAIMNGLNSKIIKALFIPVPPLSEQKDIQLFIKYETEKMETTIATIEKEITLTQEYRTALITEAVTGKIDVRDYDIPAMQEEETYEDLSLATEDTAEYQN